MLNIATLKCTYLIIKKYVFLLKDPLEIFVLLMDHIKLVKLYFIIYFRQQESGRAI